MSSITSARLAAVTRSVRNLGSGMMQTQLGGHAGKLTRTTAACRHSDSQWRNGARVLLAALCAAAFPVAGSGAPASWHSTADIAAVAEAYLLERLGGTPAGTRHGGTRVKAGMLDARLKLTACDAPLQGFLRAGSRIGQKTIVGVRCPGSRPWKLYVPVVVETRSRVWVARRPLPRGHLLEPDDLQADIRDVSGMTAGYVSNPQSLLGQRLRTSVLAGRVLSPRLLEADDLVGRGQTVTLAVAGRGLNIRMSGKALMDGALNERIRVENLHSGRIVEGIVRSREVVEVLVPGADRFTESAPKVSARPADTGLSNNDR